MYFVEHKTLTKFVAAQVCRPHMLFLCLHVVCSPSKSFIKPMENVSCQEKNYLLKMLLKKRVKHCYCVRKSVRDEASKQLYFNTFKHPCRGIPLINVEKWILTFFSRRCSLSFYQWISSNRSDLLSHVARKFIICTSMEQKCRVIITRVSAKSYQRFMIAIAMSFYPC